MAKKTAPTVIGVLTTPAPPTWWAANRHKVLLAAGLAVGFWLGTHASDAAPQPAMPRPAHTTPADPSVRPLPTTSR
ncbi:hypothetical protein [Actinacidiphila glaucinigra]|uniref:hypothetical protein n=1 Tax=Actinacidiphila glaucinigra TaxID=235986 RepID=UPI0035DDAFC2